MSTLMLYVAYVLFCFGILPLVTSYVGVLIIGSANDVRVRTISMLSIAFFLGAATARYLAT